jgi:hypothetical protein
MRRSEVKLKWLREVPAAPDPFFIFWGVRTGGGDRYCTIIDNSWFVTFFSIFLIFFGFFTTHKKKKWRTLFEVGKERN